MLVRSVVFASLYNDRAIAYRVHHGFAHEAVALSVGVQRMVRSDLGASGVMFTMDTESGFADAVFITPRTGWGRRVVQGAVNPDEFTSTSPGCRPGGRRSSSAGSGPRHEMTYSGERTALGRTTEFVDVPEAERGCCR